MKLLIGRMVIKVGEDLEDGCGVGHSKDRKKKVKKDRVREGRENERVRTYYSSIGQNSVQ